MAHYEDLVRSLYDLQPEMIQDRPEPVLLELTPDARALWRQFCNEHAEARHDFSGGMRSAWSKLEGYAARIALLVHCIRLAGGEQGISEREVDLLSLKPAVGLSSWFAHEAARLYDVLGVAKDESEETSLIRWIQQRGGVVTVAQCQRGHRRFKTSSDAERTLRRLSSNGYGEMAVEGRSTKFVLGGVYAPTSTIDPDTGKIE